jgi:hypothetical protein
VDLTITAMTFAKGAGSPYTESDNCTGAANKIAPGGSCSITVSSKAGGTTPDTLNITSNAFSSTAPAININGAATSTVPSSGTTCNGTYSGTFQGNVTVSAGQNCSFVSGGVNGNVTENGGSLTLAQSQVVGNVQISAGAFNIGPGSGITGNLQIGNLPTGSGVNQVCGTTVHNDLQLQNSGTAVVIGNPASCAGNTIGGNLQVQNNTASTTLDGNTVTGNLQDNNNTGSTQVFNNSITKGLQCGGNTTITGGGNTAGSKQGQCATF